MLEERGDLVRVAEYGSRFDADTAAAVLRSEGLAAAVPEVDSGPTYSTLFSRVFSVVVQADALDRARAILVEHGATAEELGETSEPLPWRGAAGVLGFVVSLVLLIGIGVTPDTGAKLGLTAGLAAVALGLVALWATAPVSVDHDAEREGRHPLVRGVAWLLAIVFAGGLVISLVSVLLFALRGT